MNWIKRVGKVALKVLDAASSAVAVVRSQWDRKGGDDRNPPPPPPPFPGSRSE